MTFFPETDALVCREGYETVRVEPWGRDALRVRATKTPDSPERITPWNRRSTGTAKSPWTAPARQ